MIKTLSIISLILLMILPIASASQFITGFVNDAKDGTQADGHTIIITKINPTSERDILVDIIGPKGYTGTSNFYMFDCELLQSSCQAGDELFIKVINNGDGYVTNYARIIVSGSGFDIVSDLNLFSN